MRSTESGIASRERRGFTITELLVVIGIIVLLIALLLPAIRGARRQANLLQCSSNLRTLVQASLLHAQAHHGYLPLAGYITADPSTGWSDYPSAIGDSQRSRYLYASSPRAMIGVSLVPLPAALAPYLGVRNLPFDNWDDLDLALNAKEGVWRHFMCPDTDALEKARYSADPTNNTPEGQGTMMACAIGPAQILAWATNSDYGLNEGLLGYHYDSSYSHNRLRGNLAKIHRASEVAIYTDATPRKTQALRFMPLGWICWTPSIDGVGPATLGDAFANDGRADSIENFDFNRHSRRMNVAFVDGHVETIPLKQQNLDKVYLIPP